MCVSKPLKPMCNIPVQRRVRFWTVLSYLGYNQGSVAKLTHDRTGCYNWALIGTWVLERPFVHYFHTERKLSMICCCHETGGIPFKLFFCCIRCCISLFITFLRRRRWNSTYMWEAFFPKLGSEINLIKL